MKKIVIGVCGKIGSGKTTFCKMLERYGVFHIESDKIVHSLYGSGEKGAKIVEKIFGKKYLTASGSVDRMALRDYFINGHGKFKLFLSLLYPLVATGIRKLIKQTVRPEYSGRTQVYIINALKAHRSSKSQFITFEFIDFDAPDFKKSVDYLLYIECKESLILKRYASPRFPASYIKKVMALQRKPSRPDFVISNNSTKTDLRLKAEKFIRNLKYDIFHI